MPNHLCHADDWLYFVESQVNKSLPERLELLPGLRARFGNLLRDEIVSVMLEFDERQYVVAIAAIGDSVINRPIDHYIPAQLLNRPDPFEWQSLLPVAHEWVIALDGVDAAHEFGLFTRHALALIERVSSNLEESAYEYTQKSGQFYVSLAQDMGMEFAPAIRKKIEATVRAQYKANPANDMAGEYPENEWQELGAMLYDGSHVLLEAGLEQLRSAVYSKIKALSNAEKLTLWFGLCENQEERLGGRTLADDFNVLHDTDTFDPFLESICDDLQSAMQSDWEKRLREIEASDLEIDE
ncbi:hypothetical protein RO575_14120 [Methylomonas sp. MO1]|uniref:hypothetical protein n=1 Tax=Methylomonas sp. MO1 TaxID=3073619 RepID=UPI0028A355EB|nr:hypothetical protein [Methylomonas sp. MO1]MDT4290696.1 hypothetical protein [Methylomonas sp. MO1]